MFSSHHHSPNNGAAGNAIKNFKLALNKVHQNNKGLDSIVTFLITAISNIII